MPVDHTNLWPMMWREGGNFTSRLVDKRSVLRKPGRAGWPRKNLHLSSKLRAVFWIEGRYFWATIPLRDRRGALPGDRRPARCLSLSEHFA
jgi:hypothetical protein